MRRQRWRGFRWRVRIGCLGGDVVPAFALPVSVDGPFDLNLTLRCGQGHRWRWNSKTQLWNNMIGCEPVSIGQPNGANTTIHCTTQANHPKVEYWLRRQFRLLNSDDHIGPTYNYLKRDLRMAPLVTQYWGLRVMRVDFWECLAFFMVSGGMAINAGKTIIDNIATVFHGKTYPFPTVDLVATLGGRGKLKARYPRKGPPVHEAARNIRVQQLRFSNLVSPPQAQEVLDDLAELRGIDDKVANCVLLFSLEQSNGFPVDRHIYRALECLYGTKPGFPKQVRSQLDAKEVREWVQKKNLFGPYSGYASQFLFKHGSEYHRKRSMKCHNQSATG